MAAASGLALVGGAEGNDAMAASTTGTGELIDLALDAGAQQDHRLPRRVGDDRRRPRRGAGDPRTAPPARRRAARRLRRAHPVRRRGRRRSARRRAPRRRRCACSPGGSSGSRRSTRQEHGIDVRDVDGCGRGRRTGRRRCSRSAASSCPASTSSPTSSTSTTRSPPPTSSITGEGFLDEQSFEGKVVGGVQRLAATADARSARDRRRRRDRRSPTGSSTSSLVAEFGEERATERAACVHRARRADGCSTRLSRPSSS